jgi:Fe-S cluster biosynthesis and repair protein YggX
MKRYLWIILFLCGKVIAQDLQVMVTDIREERRLDQKDATLELLLRVNGMVVDQNRKIRVGKLIKAKDNLGNELAQVLDYFSGDYTDQNEIKLKMQAPLRAAKELTQVEGTIKYFTPTEANKGLIKSKLVYNKNLVNEKEVKIMLINEEDVKKMKAEDDEKLDKELEKMTKENKEMADLLVDLKDIFSSLFSSSDVPCLHFIVDDPEKKVVEIQVLKGEPMNSGWYSSDKYDHVTRTFKTELDPANLSRK